jgi:hypothetical protein
MIWWVWILVGVWAGVILSGVIMFAKDPYQKPGTYSRSYSQINRVRAKRRRGRR